MISEESILLLRTFERYRITNGHSPESFFTALNPRGTKTCPINEFAENMVEYFGSGSGANAISLEKSMELTRFLVDFKPVGEIGLRDIKLTLKKHKNLTTVAHLLDKHPNTTPSLAQRQDFQAYYSEWNSENGVPPLCLVEGALRVSGEERKPGDLQIIYKWLKQKKILVHVAHARLLAVCRQIHLFDCPVGTNVVTQGDPGDAFYIVLSGTLDISIGGVVVSTIGAGTSFGEKALENNAPRAATVTAMSPCRLMVLMATEYQSLAATAQHKQKQDMIDFLYLKCPVLRRVSRARIAYLVSHVVKQCPKKDGVILHQGEVASALYVVMTGKVAVSRRVSPPQSAHEGRSESQGHNDVHRQKIPDMHIVIRELVPGDVFGDDCLRNVARGRNRSSYSAIAASDGCSVIMINRKEVKEYFAGGKGETLKHLIDTCKDLHSSDEVLWEANCRQLKQQRLLMTLRESAYGEAYRGRTAYAQLLQGRHETGSKNGFCSALQPDSRAMSSATLMHKELQNKCLLAQMEYAQKAVSITQTKYLRRDSVLVPGRRGSVQGRRASLAAVKHLTPIPAV